MIHEWLITIFSIIGVILNIEIARIDCFDWG